MQHRELKMSSRLTSQAVDEHGMGEIGMGQIVGDRAAAAALEWRCLPGLIAYDAAMEAMAARVQAIREGRAGEAVWLLEHPASYTCGVRGQEADILERRFPIFKTKRGGQVTYHGPGQRVVYAMLDLNRRGRHLHAFVRQMEAWLIAVLARFDVIGERREGRVGVWVVDSTNGGEKKIAAIGIRAQGWVTSHGFSLNVAPDLSHFAGIVPCGLRSFGVTSLAALGCTATMEEVDQVIWEVFGEVFGDGAAETIS